MSRQSGAASINRAGQRRGGRFFAPFRDIGAHPGDSLIALGVNQGVTPSILILASLPSVVFLFPKWRRGLQHSLWKLSAADYSSHLGF